jgi:hypothetical protein
MRQKIVTYAEEELPAPLAAHILDPVRRKPSDLKAAARFGTDFVEANKPTWSCSCRFEADDLWWRCVRRTGARDGGSRLCPVDHGNNALVYRQWPLPRPPCRPTKEQIRVQGERGKKLREVQQLIASLWDRTRLSLTDTGT